MSSNDQRRQPDRQPDRQADRQADRQPEAASSRPSRARALLGVIQAVFLRQVTLRRDGQRMQVVLAAGAPSTPAPADVAAAPPAAPMRRELSALLDAGADSRRVLKHLAALEHRLAQGDANCVQGLSLSTLQILLRQLHGLVRPPATPGIERLLSQLLDAIDAHDRPAARGDRHGLPISSFFVDHKLEMREISDSAFEAATASPDAPGR